MEWQEATLAVPVHAAAMRGDTMFESRNRIVVMDKSRRIEQAKYTFILSAKAIGKQKKKTKSVHFRGDETSPNTAKYFSHLF
jgi:hypothetical protein